MSSSVWSRQVRIGIEDVVPNEAVRALARQWRQIRASSDDLPDLKHFDWTNSPLAGKLMVLRALDAAGLDFEYVYYGREIAVHSKVDMTGRRVSEFGGDLSAFFVSRYQEVLRSREPLYTVHYSQRTVSVLTWERLILPLRHPEGETWLVVYNAPLAFHDVLLESVLDASADAVLALQPIRKSDEADAEVVDWLIILANGRAVDLLDISSQAPAGQFVSAVISRWASLGLHDLLVRSLGVSKTEPIEVNFPAGAKARRGIVQHETTYCIAQVSSMGVSGCVLRLTDVSDQKLYESLLWDAKMRAEEAALARSTFLATMSHEIRTPMNGVIGMTQLLLDTPLSADQREYAQTIRTSGESLLSVINDVLDFSKIESGRMDLANEAFDLRDCIESAIDMVAPVAQRKQLDLILWIEPDVPAAIWGDDSRLCQVLLNLVGNALKFTERGEVYVSVKRAPLLADNRPRLEFSVRDSGIGIAPEIMPKLFRAFEQGDSSTHRRFGGTGLGLAITERIIRAMGGQVRVESQVGEGSTFYASFVAVEAPAVRERPAIDPAVVAGKRVLLVNDNPTNLRVLQLQCERWGLSTVQSEDAVEALTWLAGDGRFDLLITDMNLVHGDGVWLAQRAREAKPDLPIILLSSTEVRRTEAAQWFNATLLKPVRQDALFTAVARCLGLQIENERTQKRARQQFDSRLADRYPMRVLLVEDNEVNRKVAARMLSGFGYGCSAVSNGKEAVELLQKNRFDLVFMDIQMPVMDGLEATRRIHALWPDERRPWICGMSADAMQGDRERALSAGMDDYITKPVMVAALREALRKAFRSCCNPQGDSTDSGRSEIEGDVPETALDMTMIEPLMELDASGAFLREVIESFEVNASETIERMREAAPRGDHAELARCAHQLKGLAGNLGAKRLRQLCEILDMRAKARDIEDATDRVESIHQEYLGVLNEFEGVLQSLT